MNAPRVEMEGDGVDIFVKVEGVKVAKRAEGKMWISLEPGFTVRDMNRDGELVGIEVEHNGVRVH